MSQLEMENRLAALEKAVAELQHRLAIPVGANGQANQEEPWWVSQVGKYKDVPGFDEVVRLGRKYRDSQNPYLKKKPRKAKQKKPK